MSYERGGLGVLVARGRTSLYEGESARSTTALARIASGARLRAALLITRATPLHGSGDVAGHRAADTAKTAPGQVRVVADHLNLSGGPLFPATGMVSAGWDANLAEQARPSSVGSCGEAAPSSPSSPARCARVPPRLEPWSPWVPMPPSPTPSPRPWPWPAGACPLPP